MIDLVKDQEVHFEYYRDGEMWYKTDNGFLYPFMTRRKLEMLLSREMTRLFS